MESPTPISDAPPSPSLPSFIHRLTSDLTTHLSTFTHLTKTLISHWPPSPLFPAGPIPRPSSSSSSSSSSPFASIKHAFDVALSTSEVARTLAGTSVYTVSNTNNEFVLISDSTGGKSVSLLCFRREDAEAFLAQVQARKKELRIQAKVVPITLDQVYSLKVEGIAFRFLPDPIQIQNALELSASDHTGGFDGVPVFQSDLLVVKKKKKRYSPIYFRKEDLEKELSSRVRGAGVSQHIAVGSLEDVLRKMEMSEMNSGWDDLIFIPPGKNYSQHIQEVANA